MTVRVLEVMAMSAGGIGRHVAALVAGLDSPDLSIDVAAPQRMKVPMPKPPLQLEIPRGLTWKVVRSRRDLRALVRSGSYDVVHAHGLRAGLVAVRASTGVPVVVTLHNLIRPETSGPFKSVLFRRGEAAIVRGATRVFVVSEDMVEILKRRAPDHAGKVELLHIGLPQPAASRSRDAVRQELDAMERPLVVTVARLERQKALHVLLDAVALVDGAVLAVIGDGSLRRVLEDHAAARGISDRVRFLGWREEVGDYLHAADVFALSSTWEARALAAQEAILAGVPVVSTDVGGMPELVTDQESGRLVPPNDPAAFAEALRSALEAPEEAQRYARRAREALLEGYSNEAMLARVAGEYGRLGGAG